VRFYSAKKFDITWNIRVDHWETPHRYQREAFAAVKDEFFVTNLLPVLTRKGFDFLEYMADKFPAIAILLAKPMEEVK
jgi:hypothetical protein